MMQLLSFEADTAMLALEVEWPIRIAVMAARWFDRVCNGESDDDAPGSSLEC